MKFKQKVFIFIVILIVDMILAWGAVRMWKGRGEIFDTHEGKPVDMGRIPVPGEGMTTEVSGHDHSGAGRSERLYQICTVSRKTSQKSIRHSPSMTAQIPNTQSRF